MDTKPTNSTESPPSKTPPPSDGAPQTPPSSSTPPPDASSPPPHKAASPPPPNASSPPPPNASSPPPPKASSPPPPSNSADSPPSPSANPNNAPPPPKSPEKSPSPPSTNSSQSPPAPSEKPPENSPPSPQSPINSPPAPPSGQSQNSSSVPPSNGSGNSPPVPPSDEFEKSPPPPSSSSLSEPPPENPLILSPPSSYGPPPVSPGPVSDKSESNGQGIGTAGAVAIGFVLLGVIGMAVFWLWRRKRKVSPEVHSSPQSEYALLKMRYSPANVSSRTGYESSSETPAMGKSRNWYSYEELARATNEFSESNLLGEGGFGSVFKGLLPDGRVVAVKQLKDGGGQGEREFRAEVETITRVHHRHLVSLVGYCISDEKRLLVYNYVPNNTLHFHLHAHGEPVLDWPTRLKIAIGAARGIAYLHEDCHPRIVHRDIKSSNILLDNNFEAQVSDFGLARLFSDANTHVTTRVVGTFGYMAPEYASSGKLTEKSDVFSFGVVLLELITGRKPVDTSQPAGEESVVEWARPLLNYALEKEEFQKLVDPRLGENYVDGEMFRVIEAAAACVRYSAIKRPRMSQILRALDDITVSDLSNGMRVGESTILDSTQNSAEMRVFRRMAFSIRDYSTDFFMQGDFQSEEQ